MKMPSCGDFECGHHDSIAVMDATMAALDPEGKNLILGECKYWKEPIGLNVLHALETKACDVAWERDRRKVWYVLFSISGFSDELRNHAATRDDLLLIDDGER